MKNEESTNILTGVIKACIEAGASDIHLVPGRRPALRTDGVLHQVKTIELTAEHTTKMFKAMASEAMQVEMQHEGSVDFGFRFQEGEVQRSFRVAAFRCGSENTVTIVLRLVPNKLMSFEEIGLPAPVETLCKRPQGLFLVTGPTGSGKTTTLATMIDYINRTQACNIITIEDPIEYVHTPKRAIVNQREVGTNLPDFLSGVRSSLRQDPDVILIGEMRDLETMQAAMRAAETGHLVFATLHTTGCSGTINRIIDAFPNEQQNQIKVQLSTALIAVLSQRLCRKVGGGRVGAFEFMIVDDAIRHFIKTTKPVQIDSHIQTHSNQGMQLLDDHLFRLATDGVITVEEALSNARDLKGITARFEGAR